MSKIANLSFSVVFNAHFEGYQNITTVFSVRIPEWWRYQIVKNEDTFIYSDTVYECGGQTESP